MRILLNGKTNVIYTAENPLKDYNLGTTEFVTLKGTDGTDLYARVIKPANFDATKKYPVLIYVYGGPHAQLVTNSWLGGSSLWMDAFATNENYIVFTLDNRGSANRGFSFESTLQDAMMLFEEGKETVLVGGVEEHTPNFVLLNRRAKKFQETDKVPFEILVDTWENDYANKYKSWPDKYYCIDQNRKIIAKSEYGNTQDALINKDCCVLIEELLNE